MSDQLPAGAMDDILDMIRRGEKLLAVKRYKDEVGVSLVDAKAFIEQLTERLQQVEQGDVVSNIDSEITELIYSGQKIMAVKRYREQHGTSLVDAKEAIERWTDELKSRHPERFTKASGCLASVVLLTGFVLSITVGALAVLRA